MKKRYLLSALLCLAMVGCGEVPPTTSSSNNTSVSSKDTTSSSKGTSSNISSETSSSKDTLLEAKSAAKSELQAIVDEAEIDNKEDLESLLEVIFASIDKCTTIEEINQKVVSATDLLQKQIAELSLVTLKDTAIAQLRAVDTSNYDDVGQTSINGYIQTALEEIEAATTSEEINTAVTKALNSISTIKTKTANFFEGATIQVSSETISFADDKIVNTNKSGSAIIRLGHQNAGTASVTDFYITMDYENTASSSLTLRYRAWDLNSNLMVRFSDSGVVQSGSSTWDDDIKGAKVTTIEPKNNVGLKQGQKHHIEIITRGWTKTLRVDNKIVMTYNQDAYNAGYVYIESWQAGYTIENAYFHEFDSDNDLDKTSYYDKLWN